MDSWVQVSPSKGTNNEEVQIIVEANNSSDNRTTVVEAKTSTLNKNLIITQKGEDMALNKIAFDFGEAGVDKISLNGIELANDGLSAATLFTHIENAVSDTTNDTAIIVGYDYDAEYCYYCDKIERVNQNSLSLYLGTHAITVDKLSGISLTY